LKKWQEKFNTNYPHPPRERMFNFVLIFAFLVAFAFADNQFFDDKNYSRAPMGEKDMTLGN